MSKQPDTSSSEEPQHSKDFDEDYDGKSCGTPKMGSQTPDLSFNGRADINHTAFVESQQINPL